MCVVPADHVVAHYQLFTGPATLGAVAQLLHTSIDVGLAQGALDEAVRLVRDRVPGGKRAWRGQQMTPCWSSASGSWP